MSRTEYEWNSEDPIKWYEGEEHFVRSLPPESRATVLWAKRLRGKVDGRSFKVVPDGRSGYAFIKAEEHDDGSV